jgi:single-strand DNA-binding protein
MINKVILIGNLGRDPEVRRLESGAAVGKFSVATNESYQDKQGNWQTNTEWHNIVLWRALAERAEKQLKKGSLVYIEGKLTHRSYKDKDGIDRYTSEVVANTFRLLEKRESSGSSFQDAGFPGEEPTNVDKGSTTSSQPNVPAPDDDLPF